VTQIGEALSFKGRLRVAGRMAPPTAYGSGERRSRYTEGMSWQAGCHFDFVSGDDLGAHHASDVQSASHDLRRDSGRGHLGGKTPAESRNQASVDEVGTEGFQSKR